MLEIRLHTLLLIIAGSIGLIALPFVARSLAGSPVPVHAASQSLPTPTPVPTQGLSERARQLAASLVITPTPEALPTPLPPVVSATVSTDGRPLNLRRGPGLDFPVVGSAPNGLVLAVTGLSADQAWLRVEVPEWEGGVWVYAALTEVEGNLAVVPTAGE